MFNYNLIWYAILFLSCFQGFQFIIVYIFSFILILSLLFNLEQQDNDFNTIVYYNFYKAKG